jgi:hypothetical protein
LRAVAALADALHEFVVGELLLKLAVSLLGKDVMVLHLFVVVEVHSRMLFEGFGLTLEEFRAEEGSGEMGHFKERGAGLMVLLGVRVGLARLMRRLALDYVGHSLLSLHLGSVGLHRKGEPVAHVGVHLGLYALGGLAGVMIRVDSPIFYNRRAFCLEGRDLFGPGEGTERRPPKEA